MQVIVENPNTIVIDVDQGRQGRGIQNITYTEVSGQYFLIVTYTDGTTETLGPLVVTGGAAFLLGGATGSIPYQSAPNTTVFLPIGTQNQVVVAGATVPQYTSALTGLTVNNSAIGNTTPSTGAFTNLSASGTFALTGDQVQISEGGTGQTTANAAFNALAPSQTGNSGKYLKTDGTNSSWDQLDISTADITGTLPIANGGTGQTTANSALNALLPTQAAQSGKYLKTDGTNASWDQLDISTADITGVLPVANGGTGASTASGARANLSAAILGTNNDITSMTGLTGGISTPDFVQFDTTATEANAVGKVYWDAAQGTLDLGLLGGNVVSRIGQSLVAYVTNAEAVTITKGQAVYLFGAQGDRATVKLASNLSDATSAKTFGVVAENIPANGTGFVMCQGVLEGLNLGAFTAGDTLYLGATPGSLTATKPYAPNHLVYVGLVERANAGNGQLYVKVQNGYELDEIHDVQIINPQNGQTILYDASTSLWKNANLTAGTGVSVTNGAASVTIGNTGVLSFSGGTTGLTPATSTTGAVTLGGTLAVASGGTGATTAGGALTNLGAASSAITISAGTGLTGGGDLTANRTLSIANTAVTAASYGSASSVGTFTVNAQGQLTAAASTPIAIANTQVSGLGTMSTQNSNSVTITGGSITGITDLAIADGGTGASDAPTARTNLGLGTSATLNAGVALGVATLDAGGTVPLTQLPASIQGGVSYQGSWNAATNTPTITSGVGSKGYYYVVSVAGSTNIDGITDWLPGDWIIFNGTVWQKIDNTDAVASVNGYTGVVVLSAADVGAPPTSRTITAGTGLSGGGDLSANRTISIDNTTVAAGSYGSASSVGTFTVNGQGQLTAAASTPIAITNTQVSGLGTMSTQNANAVAITGGSVDGTTIGGTTRAAGSFTTLTLTNALDIANGGTGQTTANAAFNALAPSQTGNAGKYLTTDGTNTSWATNPLGTVTSVDVSGGTTGLTTSGGPITSSGTITLGGTLATTNGGTGLTSFTANGVVYASSSSALTTGSALQFDGSNLTLQSTNTAVVFNNSSATPAFQVGYIGGTNRLQGRAVVDAPMTFYVSDSEQMRLTSTGLGIGTSSLFPGPKLSVYNSATLTTGGDGGGNGVLIAASTGSASSGQLVVAGSDTAAIDKGGAIVFAGKWDTATNDIGQWAKIVGYKENATNNNYSAYLGFYTRANGAAQTEKMRLDSSGNLGLGVTPSAGTSGKVFQITNAGHFMASGPTVYIDANAYFDSGWKYITTAAASNYYQNSGAHIWQTAPSDTAGNTITFTQAMTLDANGDLALGTTSITSALASRRTLELNGSSSSILNLDAGGTRRAQFYADASLSLLGTTTASPLAFYTNDVERARITSTGDVGIGTSSPAARLSFGTSTSSASDLSSVIRIYDVGGTNGNNYGFGFQSSTGRVSYTAGLGGYHSFYTANTERMRLDPDGNLGLGVTPKGWTAFKASQVNDGSLAATTGNNTVLASNAYYDGSWRYSTSGDYAGYYQQISGGHRWHTASATGTAGNIISFTQAMTLDASGNLGVGTTSPINNGGYGGFSLNGTSGALLSLITNGTESSRIASISNETSIQCKATTGYITFVQGVSGGTERARITSGGDFCVGTASTTNASLINWYKASGTIETSLGGVTTAQNHIVFANPNGNVGSIQVDGSATSYNTTSDYRLKDNPQPLTGSGAFIDALKPKTWNWKADGSRGVGFIAHEVQEVSPGSVVGTKDAVDADGKPVMQAMEYGSAEFIANIIAELQSLRARVAQLEAK